MIDPSDLIKFARELYGPSANEVRLRGAISRAYYGAYHYCDQIADKYCGELSESDLAREKGMHIQLFVRMDRYCDDVAVVEDVRILGQQAKKLHYRRIKADYDLTGTIVGRDVNESLSWARDIEEGAKKLLSPEK